MKLRDYQQRAVNAIGRCLREEKSTLLVMATGLGKSVTFAYAIKEHCPGRALVLAHREELIEQNAKTIRSVLGPDSVDIEMADQHADLPGLVGGKAKVVVASKDSLHAGRIGRFDPREFSLIVSDECFPAGTLVSGRPIESLRVGDWVGCVDPAGDWVPVMRRVARTFKKRPKKMVRITISGGQRLVCTTNHPIWVDSQRRWKNAGDVTCGDMVSRLTTYGHKELHRLRQDVLARSASSSQDLLARVPSENILSHNGQDQQEVCVCSHEGEESYVACGDSAKGIGHHAGNGASSDCSRREREGTDGTGAANSRSVRVDDQSDCADGCQKGQHGTSAVALQDRRRTRTTQNRPGDRRGITQNAFPQDAGQKERRFLERARVDRVEILESGCDGTFGGVCPDGFVYNLEVEEYHTYFADGIVVHNCHHATADTYARIYTYFAGVPHLGVTATPDRHDGEALGRIFNSCAMIYGIAEGIKDGYLVPVHAKTVVVHGLDLSTMHTVGGDFNQGELAEQMEAERCIHEVCASATESAGTRRAIVFTVSVRQAAALAQVFNDYRPGSADWVCGETPKEQRRDIIARHKRNEFQFLCNVGVLTEGYDDPGASLIVMARPTKSRSLFAQMLGRATRPLPGIVDNLASAAERVAAIKGSPKPQMLVLDYTGNCGKHKLVSAADVLGGKFSQSAIDKASEAAIGEEVDVAEQLKKSERAAADDVQSVLYNDARAKIIAAAKYLLHEQDLFDGAFTPGRERDWMGGKAPTENQLACLDRHGFRRQDCEKMSRNECSRLIGAIVARTQVGLCTIKQAKTLERFGVKNAENTPFDQAGTLLDQYLSKARTRRYG